MTGPVTPHAMPLRLALNRLFVQHFFEMFLAMLVGMLVLDSLAAFMFSSLANLDLFANPILFAPVMTLNMTIGMVLWMLFRRHSPRSIGEMAGAMVLPLCILLGPHWIGIVPGSILPGASMALSIPSMILVMLYRRDVYAQGHHNHSLDHEHHHTMSIDRGGERIVGN